MKKLLLAILLICFVSGIAFAKDPVTCTMPKDTQFAMVNIMYGPVGVVAAEDVRIHVLEVMKDVKNPNDSKQKKDVIRFSISYDKPSIKCPQHGVDTYEMYSPFLAIDDGLVFKESLTNCSNEL